MAVSERYESRSCEQQGLTVRGTRVWDVDALPHVALLEPGIPLMGTTFLFNGIAATLRSLSVERFAPNKSIVTGQYDNDGSGRGPPGNDDRDPEYKDYGIQQVRDVERVPCFNLYWDVTVSTDVNGLPFGTRSPRWEPYELIVDAWSTTATVRVNVNQMNAGVQRLIRAQRNTIHTFPDATKWLFIGARTQSIDKDLWQIDYDWIGDDGQTAVPSSSLVAPDGSPIPSNTSDDQLPAGTLIVPTIPRPPFAKYRVIPANDVGERPSIGVVLAESFRRIEPLGWNSLPGGPIP